MICEKEDTHCLGYRAKDRKTGNLGVINQVCVGLFDHSSFLFCWTGADGKDYFRWAKKDELEIGDHSSHYEEFLKAGTEESALDKIRNHSTSYGSCNTDKGAEGNFDK
jgi:hypothetical protein